MAAVAVLTLVAACSPPVPPGGIAAGPSIAAPAPTFAGQVAPASAAPAARPRSVEAPGPPTALARPASRGNAASAQQLAEQGVANAAGQDVEQSVALIDRVTGERVVSVGGDEQFNAESILKVATAAYYLIDADGAVGTALTCDLKVMIGLSDNGIQASLWQADIVPSIAERYGLSGTRNSRNPSAGTWGSDRTTANDQATLLWGISQDPLVGPPVLDWMAGATADASDGFDQYFGFNAEPGDHGSKQGWSDPGWSPANLHSVGWNERYFGAVLQRSTSATYATMRATANTTLELVSQADATSVSASEAMRAIPGDVLAHARAVIDEAFELAVHPC